MTAGLRVAALVFLAVILQVSILASVTILGGTPDLLLVVLIVVGLIRGAVPGAVIGFCAGLLVDVATLGTLGVDALLLTLAGYWAGRYGETTGRDRAHATPLATVVITILFAVAGLGLHAMLGDPVSARRALVTTLLPAIPLNLLLAWPVSRLCRRIVSAPAGPVRPTGLELNA